MPYNNKKLPIVSGLLVAVNVLVFLVCLFNRTDPYRMGSLYAPVVVYRHEYGRLITSMFLHANVEHLFNNMIILFFLGSMLEEEVGHIPFGILYFLSGISGGIATIAVCLLTNDFTVSVGASGAVFGLDGLLLALALTSGEFRRRMPLNRVLVMILLSVYAGFSEAGINNSAHLGGLAAGFLFGTLFLVLRNLLKASRAKSY